MAVITITITREGKVDANVSGVYPVKAVNDAIRDFKERIKRAMNENGNAIIG